MRQVWRAPAAVAPVVIVGAALSVHAADCNGNGVDDATEVATNAAADCDGDGVLDVCEDLPRVALPRTWLAGGECIAIAIAELDGTGDADIVRMAGNFYEVHRMRAGAPYSVESELIMPRGEQSMTVADFALADLDGDGNLDLGFTGQTAAVLRFNRGDANFDSPIRMAPGGLSMVVADLDEDGDADVAIGPRSLYVNRGNRTFVPSQALPAGLVKLHVAIDGDGDGDQDLVGGHAEPSTQLIIGWNGGDAKFQETTNLVLPSYSRQLIALDIEGDQDLDLAYADEGPDGGFLIRNVGSRDFQAAQPLMQPGARAVASSDWNGDGRPDLLACSFGHAALLLNAGGEAFLVGHESDDAPYGPRDASGGDLDGDGDPDAVIGGQQGWSRHLTEPLPSSHDCNGNGILDACDIAAGTTRDGDGNSVPDECEPPRFHRGDSDADGTMNIADAVVVLRFLFIGDVGMPCRESGDADNDGIVAVTDAVRILTYLFGDGPVPASPGPPGALCGPDPDPTGTPANLGCAAYDRCDSP